MTYAHGGNIHSIPAWTPLKSSPSPLYLQEHFTTQCLSFLFWLDPCKNPNMDYLRSKADASKYVLYICNMQRIHTTQVPVLTLGIAIDKAGLVDIFETTSCLAAASRMSSHLRPVSKQPWTGNCCWCCEQRRKFHMWGWERRKPWDLQRKRARAQFNKDV